MDPKKFFSNMKNVTPIVKDYIKSAPQRFKALVKGVVQARDSKAVREERNKGVWKAFFKLIAMSNLPYWALVMVACVILFYNQLSIQGFIYMAEIIDGDYTNLIIALAANALSMFLAQFQMVFNMIANEAVSKNIRYMAVRKLMWLKPSFYIENDPRELVTRAIQDVSRMSQYILGMVRTAANIPGMVQRIILISRSGVGALQTVVIINIFQVVLNFIFGRINMHLNAQNRERVASIGQYMGERMSSVGIIKTFVAEGKEEKRAYALSQKLMSLEIKTTFVGIFRSIISLPPGIIQTFLICSSGYKFIAEGTMIRRDAVLYYQFSQGILTSILGLYQEVWSTTKSTQGAIARISKVLSMEEEDYKSGISISEADLSKDLVFENITFGYKGKNVLNGVSFTAPHGKLTAIVGPSGSGKTSLIKLAERFYDPFEGSIKLGDTDIRTYNLKEWRDLMGYVTQDSTLMSGTIRHNILYGVNYEVSDEEFDQACKLGDVYSFVNEQANGFDTQVGEYGSRLSGGQKQRIGIARAVLRRPRMMLFDEPTASLDPQSEATIQQSIRSLSTGRTSILVAHKINAVKKADQIVLIDKGVVAGIGTHEELVANNPRYTELFKLEQESPAEGDA